MLWINLWGGGYEKAFREGIAIVGDIWVGREITCISSACHLPTAALPLNHFRFLRDSPAPALSPSCVQFP